MNVRLYIAEFAANRIAFESIDQDDDTFGKAGLMGGADIAPATIAVYLPGLGTIV